MTITCELLVQHATRQGHVTSALCIGAVASDLMFAFRGATFTHLFIFCYGPAEGDMIDTRDSIFWDYAAHCFPVDFVCVAVSACAHACSGDVIQISSLLSSSQLTSLFTYQLPPSLPPINFLGLETPCTSRCPDLASSRT